MTVTVISVLIILVTIKTTQGKCTDSFATLCDSVFDVTRYGRKQWTNLIIQTNQCDVTTAQEILQSKTLEKCPNLEELYIIERLEYIENKAFQMLTNLAYLNLYKNTIKTIPKDMFSNLQNLYKLEIASNNIENIENGTFNNLPRLKTLNLANNRLSSVEEDAMFDIKGIRKLILSGNRITTIKPNVFASSLEILHLDNNLLTRLGDKTFSNLNHLKELSLSRNKLKKIQRHLFTGLGDIFKLDVSHNAVDTIDVKAFDDLHEMKLLQLAHNNLKQITAEMFPKNNVMLLQSIRLDHNELSFLSKTVFVRLSSLRRISIGGNPWQCDCLQEIQLEMNNRNVNYTPCDYQHYFTGNHPTCMKYKNACIENVDLVEDNFLQMYNNALQSFSYDCP
ncbi:uncharacterized protein CBL_11157 [Carabus blaptoides fortunei]